MTLPIGAIGSGDEKSNGLQMDGSPTKKKPWENYAGAFGNFIGNLPTNFNSAFTVSEDRNGIGAAKL